MDRLFILLCMILYLMLVIDSIEAIFHCDGAHRRFQCKNGQCLSLLQRCDFKIDCLDKSDEEGCDYPACDNTTHFQCNNKKCIHKGWVCDGSDDCFDNSDEAEDLCSAHSCSSEQFHCYRSTECFPMAYKCDGENDCEDGEDEKNCPPIECGDNEFRCANKRECVDKGFRCDGEEDCEDGSDESTNCTIICRDDEFLCDSRDYCVMGTWKCDGIRDCRDGSDEKNCTGTHICSKGYFPCAHSSVCIPQDWRCDGDRECADGSDELNCDNFKKRCPYGDRLCANRRQCINKSKWCDGARDCVDRSDETECPVHSYPSSDCPHTTHFRCPGKNGSCILEHRMCDGFTDCKGGGEDEQQGPHFCGYDECEGPTNGNCSHICVDKRLSYECDCPPGLKLGVDKMTCEDVNECESVDNPCDRYCFNTNGSYKCACDEGHVLVRGRHCKPSKSRYDVKLVVTDRNKIEQIKLDKRQDVWTVMSNINVESVAVDIKNDFVYWSDAKAETITRLEAHVKSCKWRKHGYSKEEVKEIIEEEDNKAKNDSTAINYDSIISQIAPHAGLIRSDQRYKQELNPEQRLAVYNAEVAQCYAPDKPLPDKALYADLQSKAAEKLYQKENPENLSKVELLQKLRDMKRRRLSYRAKNVHITKRSQTEIVRGVLEVHMEELRKLWNPETTDHEKSPEKSLSKERRGRDTHKPDDESRDQLKHQPYRGEQKGNSEPYTRNQRANYSVREHYHEGRCGPERSKQDYGYRYREQESGHEPYHHDQKSNYGDSDRFHPSSAHVRQSELKPYRHSRNDDRNRRELRHELEPGHHKHYDDSRTEYAPLGGDSAQSYPAVNDTRQRTDAQTRNFDSGDSKEQIQNIEHSDSDGESQKRHKKKRKRDKSSKKHKSKRKRKSLSSE